MSVVGILDLGMRYPPGWPRRAASGLLHNVRQVKVGRPLTRMCRFVETGTEGNAMVAGRLPVDAFAHPFVVSMQHTRWRIRRACRLFGVMLTLLEERLAPDGV